jgi:hypothetical protein
MAGYNTDQATINHRLGQVAVSLRDVMLAAQRFQTAIVKLGADDTARIQALIADGCSPGDAAQIVTDANLLGNVAGVYYGQVQQGGSGGTGAVLYNFDDALAHACGLA